MARKVTELLFLDGIGRLYRIHDGGHTAAFILDTLTEELPPIYREANAALLKLTSCGDTSCKERRILFTTDDIRITRRVYGARFCDMLYEAQGEELVGHIRRAVERWAQSGMSLPPLPRPATPNKIQQVVSILDDAPLGTNGRKRLREIVSAYYLHTSNVAAQMLQAQSGFSRQYNQQAWDETTDGMRLEDIQPPFGDRTSIGTRLWNHGAFYQRRGVALRTAMREFIEMQREHLKKVY